MPRVYKLSMDGLRKFIAEQRSAVLQEFGAMGDPSHCKPKETEADGYADTLEKHINYLQKQGIHEAKLIRRLKQLRESMRIRKKKINELRVRRVPAKKKK